MYSAYKKKKNRERLEIQSPRPEPLALKAGPSYLKGLPSESPKLGDVIKAETTDCFI